MENTRSWWFTALLACGLLTACGATPASTGGSKAVPDSIKSPERAISLFGNGKTPPPSLRRLTPAQAAHLQPLQFSYGPTYERGAVIGVAVAYPALCEHVVGASVTETASMVMVRVYGSPRSRRGCALPLRGGVWAVKLPHPLGSRAELHRP